MRGPIPTMLLLGIAPAVGLGICRFAYALVLPDMRDSLEWSYSTAGLMNTINLAGYLAGALGANVVIRRLGMFRAVWIGAVACVASLAIAASSDHALVFGASRLVSGVAGAVSFIAGGALAMNVAQAHSQSTFLVSLFYSVPAVGIVISAVVAPAVLSSSGPGSWWLAWAVLAAVAAVLVALLLLVRVDPVAAPSSAAGRVAVRPMLPYLAGYFLFGAGYIAYMTFMIAFVRAAGGSALEQSAFWVALGLGAFAQSWVWRGLLVRLRSGRVTALLIALTTIAATLPLVSTAVPVLAISAIVFGNVFFAVVGSTTAYARVNFRREQWPSAIAALTAAHGAGLVLGPIATGAITDSTGDVTSALVTSAAILGLAAIATACQPALARPAES